MRLTTLIVFFLIFKLSSAQMVLTDLTFNSTQCYDKKAFPDTAKTNSKLYIYGTVISTQSKGKIESATVYIQGTKISTNTDHKGYYKLDITSISDTTKTVTLLSSCINYLTSKRVISKRFSKDKEVNFELTIKGSH